MPPKIDKMIALLCERFPKTFVCCEGRRRPLKVGITKDLKTALGDEVDGKLLVRALTYYTLNLAYLKSQRVGAARIDLTGSAAGKVTEKEAAYAKMSLARIAAQKKKPPSPVRIKKQKLALGIAALKAAALARKSAAAGG
jgi:ProP effector